MEFYKDLPFKYNDLKGALNFNQTSRAGSEDSFDLAYSQVCEKFSQRLELTNPLYSELVSSFQNVGLLTTDDEDENPESFRLNDQFGKLSQIIEITPGAAQNLISSITDIIEQEQGDFMTMTNANGEQLSMHIADVATQVRVDITNELDEVVLQVKPVLYSGVNVMSDVLDPEHLILGSITNNITGEVHYYLNTHIIDDTDAFKANLSEYIQALARSATINDILKNASTLSVGDKFDINVLTASVNSLTNNLFDGAKELMNSISEVYARSGISGIKSFISNVARKTATTEIQDGLLVFTDNSLLMPQEYIAGIVVRVVGAAISVAGIIATAFSRIIGPLLTVIGSTIMSIGQAVDYDYKNETTASLDLTNKVNEGCFPHAFFQTEYRDSQPNLSSNNLAKSLYYSGQVVKFSVPGGKLLACFVKETQEGQSHYYWYRYEFHPELSIPVWGDVAEWSKPQFGVSTFLDNGAVAVYHTSYYAYLTKGDIDVDKIMSAWVNRRPAPISNNENGVLSVKDDIKARAILFSNLMLFYLFITCYLGSGNKITFNANGGAYFPISIHTTSGSPLYRYGRTDTSDTSNGGLSNGNIKFEYCMGFAFLSQVFNDNSARAAELLSYMINESYPSTLIPSWTDIVKIADATNVASALFNNKKAFALAAPTDGTPSEWATQNVQIYSNNRGGAQSWIMSHNLFIDDAIFLSDNITYCIKTPKYNRDTFAAWIAATIIATVVVTAATITLTVIGKRKISSMKARNARNVENAWGDFLEDPSNANFKSYRKAVKKNNRFASIFGGTKYSTDGMWADVDSGGSFYKGSKYSEDNENHLTDLDIIIKLIKG